MKNSYDQRASDWKGGGVFEDICKCLIIFLEVNNTDNRYEDILLALLTAH